VRRCDREHGSELPDGPNQETERCAPRGLLGSGVGIRDGPDNVRGQRFQVGVNGLMDEAAESNSGAAQVR
jgi:hypothetical protein